MSLAPVIVWFRRDLRLSDNPAFYAAAQTGRAVIPLYVFETDNPRPLGGASRWWLHQSLASLAADLKVLGLPLVLRKGQADDCVQTLQRQSHAQSVYWNRRYDLAGRDTDAKLKADFKLQGIDVQSFKANLLIEPWELQAKTKSYYKVFTSFWRAAQGVIGDTYIPPAPVPETIQASQSALESLALEDLRLLPTRPDWGAKLTPFWQPGEAGAQAALAAFLRGSVTTYDVDRDRPDKDRGTSKLSPHLAFGEISPRQIWQSCLHRGEATKFLSEIDWREFSYTLLFYNPDLAHQNFRPDFDRFAWQQDDDGLHAWQRGQTGYPFVDAGMRQLWDTGWQHNRVRMVTASFLIKHLLIDWRVGERWFWDTLVDADPASNAASWQWVAGSGADAAPYFRVFNPITQGEKFDPDGDYVRRFVPELGKLPVKYIHRPWEAPDEMLKAANIVLGRDYPHPIVDHKFARERALAAYKSLRAAPA